MLSSEIRPLNFEMWALRFPRFIDGGKSNTGKPDGMFVRRDGLATDHKDNAALFYNTDGAAAYVDAIRASGCDYPIFIVKIQVVPAFKKQIEVLYMSEAS